MDQLLVYVAQVISKHLSRIFCEMMIYHTAENIYISRKFYTPKIAMIVGVHFLVFNNFWITVQLILVKSTTIASININCKIHEKTNLIWFFLQNKIINNEIVILFLKGYASQ